MSIGIHTTPPVGAYPLAMKSTMSATIAHPVSTAALVMVEIGNTSRGQ